MTHVHECIEAFAVRACAAGAFCTHTCGKLGPLRLASTSERVHSIVKSAAWPSCEKVSWHSSCLSCGTYGSTRLEKWAGAVDREAGAWWFARWWSSQRRGRPHRLRSTHRLDAIARALLRSWMMQRSGEMLQGGGGSCHQGWRGGRAATGTTGAGASTAGTDGARRFRVSGSLRHSTSAATEGEGAGAETRDCGRPHAALSDGKTTTTRTTRRTQR